MKPIVLDISHHNMVSSFSAIAEHGVWGIIHKATQGSGYRDPDYAKRRDQARAANLLWGAYHFNDGSDVRRQVENFISTAAPDDETLMALDYEDNPKSEMSAQQMVQFLRLAEQRLGRKLVLYGGNRIKENIGRLSTADRAYVASHQLWLCQYGPKPQLPPGFARSFLWQYSDGRVGPGPHGVPGVDGDVDLNAFNGTREDLVAGWVSRKSGPAAAADTDISSRARHAEDQDPDAPVTNTRSDDDVSLPSWLGGGASEPPRDDKLNVQPQTARYDVAVEVVQRELDRMGYHEVGTIDGRWGGKTAAAIKAFFIDRGLEGEHSEMGALLNSEIAQAKADGFKRPIAPERANATPKDLAPKVETVRVSLWGQFTAKIAAGFAAIGLTGSSLSDAFYSVRSTLQPVQDAFNRIPGTVWLLLVLIVAGAVWYVTNRAAKAATKDYNTGRLN